MFTWGIDARMLSGACVATAPDRVPSAASEASVCFQKYPTAEPHILNWHDTYSAAAAAPPTSS